MALLRLRLRLLLFLDKGQRGRVLEAAPLYIFTVAKYAEPLRLSYMSGSGLASSRRTSDSSATHKRDHLDQTVGTDARPSGCNLPRTGYQ
ncbi:hypothetical protein BN873_70041 [Candidatus Competibacter denitrificans Run_A_D11]|uniref:Uncharacterized protein n=1 Tax=Candidatus Competibacter denitrificans Run_A_D11 TaxID=1400863 RepID=W6ME29_9GAMM|nr:hypothetical protein BN873_70041 [Candidatus Competibacter denitrificans Run_A_D11]